MRRGDDAGLGKEPNGDCDSDACKEPRSKLLLACRAAGMELHDTAHTLAMRTVPTRRSTSSPWPQRHRRLLAMVFGEGSTAACALELERSGGAAAPGNPPSPAPSSSALPWRRRWRTPVRRGDGGAGQIPRPRARPVAAAAGSGGLDVRLWRWRRPPRV